MGKFTRRFGLLVVVLGLLIGASGGVRAGLYQTGFEPTDFTAGQSIVGQAGWDATASPSAGVISTMNPASGRQDLQVNGAGLQYLPSYGLYAGSYDYTTPFSGTANPQVLVQVEARLDGPGTSADLSSANLTLSGIAEIYISSQGVVYADDTNGNYFATPTAVALGQYHTLGIGLDFQTGQETFYLDGANIASLAMPSLTSTEYNVFLANIGSPDDGSYSHANYTAYFDDLSVQSVPEPASLILISMGGFGFLGRRWLRREHP